MRTLRILLPAPPEATRADAWALFDANGRVTERGHGPPSEWPPADRREAVLSADAARVLVVTLPPLPRSRLVSAASYALEDRLATPAEDVAIAIGERLPDGRVIAVVIARDLADALRDAAPPFARVIAEPDLAAPATAQAWRWCASDDYAFVRTDDGGAFAVSRTADDTLPAELALALGQAARSNRAPSQIIADRTCDPAWLAQWTVQGAVPFIAGTPWRWDLATPAAFGGAIDVLAALRVQRSVPAPSQKRYSVAIALAACAIGFHLLAMLGTWAGQRIALSQAQRALVPFAAQAGASDPDAGNAAREIARLHADARHRAGLAAPADAMPLLARAAPALAALPAGALKTATWTGGAWTLELAPLDDAALGSFGARLALAGLASLHAKTASGVRARVAPSPSR